LPRCRGGLGRIDEALALAGETGEHWSDALLHRLPGGVLLKRDPANTAPAEDALLAAVAIAQQQKARSFELCAALSLAKLYLIRNWAEWAMGSSREFGPSELGRVVSSLEGRRLRWWGTLNGPTHGRSCRARSRAQGLFADPGISRDRGSANASQRADDVSQSKEPKVFFCHFVAMCLDPSDRFMLGSPDP
jgi:hypothetical protein